MYVYPAEAARQRRTAVGMLSLFMVGTTRRRRKHSVVSGGRVVGWVSPHQPAISARRG